MTGPSPTTEQARQDGNGINLTNLTTPLTNLGLEPTSAARQISIAARPRAIPVPVPIPWLQFAHRFLIWKQDPSVGDPGIRTSLIFGLVLNGPTDSRITTELPGTTPIAKNVLGDFIYTPLTPQFDCAHTWAIVRETLTMYERLRGQLIPWAWNTGGNTDRLTAFPDAGVTANAYYSRTAKALKFFHFIPTGATAPVFTCRSLDIVAHETGHAVLDGLKPGWLSSAGPPQTGGLHESFGDLSAIFLALSQLDQVEAVVVQSRANLHNRNFIAALAEQFGAALGFPVGLRNADNDLKLSQVGNEVHAISQVFTGGMYDVLADIYAFQLAHQGGSQDPASILLEVARHLAKLLIKAIVAAPATAATFADVVNHMLTISANQGDPPIYRTFIRNRFTLREVVVSPTPVAAMMEGRVDYADEGFVDGDDVLTMEPTNIGATMDAGQDRSTCCGTMQLPEFISPDAKVLATGASLSDDELLAKDIAELRAATKGSRKS
ncbi:MAG TPA: hypothetical protein VEH31_34765 [Streptosporangiaceae bacterium]|nr:hypothetical protein [Streptosporangiaceae bacterium]